MLPYAKTKRKAAWRQHVQKNTMPFCVTDQPGLHHAASLADQTGVKAD
jgi:hypothetical protein